MNEKCKYNIKLAVVGISGGIPRVDGIVVQLRCASCTSVDHIPKGLFDCFSMAPQELNQDRTPTGVLHPLHRLCP